jgi:hypothetical protein
MAIFLSAVRAHTGALSESLAEEKRERERLRKEAEEDKGQELP